MKALKRILAMLMVIAMLMSMAIAEDEVLLISQVEEEHIHEEYALESAAVEAEEEPAELEELTFELLEEPVEELPVEEAPVEEIPAEEIPVEEEPADEIPAEEIPAEEAPADEIPAEEETLPELGLSELPALIVPEEEVIVEEEGAVVEGELVQTEGSGCDHANSYLSYTERQNIVWTEKAEFQHTGTCDTIDWYWCRDCQVHVALGGETGVSFTEEHDWQQAVAADGGRAFSCNDCGYLNTCAHNFEVTDTWRINESYKDNGDGTHTATFGDGWDETCSICGAEWTENSEDVKTIVESHDWRNGYYNESQGAYIASCWHCDAENTCDHNFELTDELISYYAGDAVDNEDGTHTKYYYAVDEYTCSKCGGDYRLEDNETVRKKTEAHEWGEYDECQWCDAYLSDNCEHPYAQPEGREYINFQMSTSTNEETHSGTCDIEQEYYCPDCESWYYKITETGVVITNEAHDWHYDWETDEETGEEYLEKHCNVCHYIDYCEHSFVMVDEDPEGRCEYGPDSDNGDGTHTVTYYYDYYYECEDCGASYEDTDWGSGYEVTEDHNWHLYGNDDGTYLGYCGQCDAENDCEHEIVRELDSRDVMTRKDNGDGTHTLTYYDSWYVTCSLCGANHYWENDDELKTVTEPHDFYDGECHECPAVIDCDHVNSYESGTSDYFEPIVHSCDEDGHTITAYSAVWYYCEDCGEEYPVVSDDYTTVNETLPHEWDSDTGACWICGVENTCEHENVQSYGTVIRPDWENGDPVLDSDDKTHTFVGYECVEGECLDCGMQMNTQIGETQEYTQAHEYYNSTRCYLCGYVSSNCVHSYVYSTAYHYYGEGTKIDHLTHTAVAYLTTTATCVKCGVSVEAKGAPAYFVEKHYFDVNGACYTCGHVDNGSCEHEVVNTYEGTEAVRHYDGNAEGHTSLMRDVYEEECAICGKVLVREYSDTYELEHEHNLNHANICTNCGYVSDCVHSYAVIKDGGYYSNAVNAYTHANIYFSMNEYSCAKCNANLVINNNYAHKIVGYAYHTWVDGFCSGCRMPQPGACHHRYEDGECAKCGLVCSHVWDGCECTICDVDTHEWNGCVCEKCGAGEHMGIADCLCDECGLTVHDLVDHVCSRCGECEHEHPFGSVCEPCKWCGYTEHVEENFVTTTVSDIPTGEYEDIDDPNKVGYHYETIVQHELVVCSICGQIVSNEAIPGTEEVVEGYHDYEDGACADCGALEPECPDSRGTGVHEDGGTGQCRYCWSCMIHFDDEPDDPGMFNDKGFCKDCGYYAEHTHVSNGDYWYGIANGESIYLDVYRHVNIGKMVKYTECKLCYEIYSTETNLGEMREVEEHYNWEDDSGFCSGCGAYMVQCSHKNTYEETYLSCDMEKGAVSYNAKTHTVYGWEITAVYCADCGEEISSNYQEVTQTESTLFEEEHDIGEWWDDEVQDYVFSCYYCDVALVECAKHTWTYKWDGTYGGYISLNEKEHALYGEHEYDMICSVCGMENDSAYFVDVNGEVSPHTYENGICADCGAKLIELDEVNVYGLDENNSITIGYYMPYQLDYEVVPANSAIKPIFTSSNRWVANVDQNGLITGMYPGSAVITISANNTENAFEPVQFTVNVAAAPSYVYVQDVPYGGDVLAVGETLQLNPTVMPANAMYELTWSSSNEAVAKVDANGLVTGAGAGYAYIYVKTQNGKYDSYLVKVNAAAEKMDLGIAGNAMEMGLGQVYQIAPMMTPVGAGSEITYTSSAPEVVSVNAYGKITAVGKGSATITVSTWGLEKQEIEIVVKDAPAQISFARNAITASLTEKTLQLNAIYDRENEATKLTWISGNNYIASVDANGLVTFNRAGTVLIAAATHNGKMAYCYITVMPNAPTKISVEPAVVDMLVGESRELKISFGAYEGCSELKVSESEYYSYEDGILTAKKVTNGPVEIVFEAPNSTEENPVKAACQVNIYPELKDIALTVNGALADDTLKLSWGQVIDLGVQRWDVNGEEMFAGAYTINCDNPYVATLFANNKLYVRGIGKAVVSVESYNEKVDTLEIETVAAPYYVTMEPYAATLGKGERMELTVKHYDPEAPTTYTFSSTNPYVAKVVEENGRYYVEAGDRVGYANIVVGTHNGKYAVTRLVVYNAPTGITLNKDKLELAAGETAKLTTTLTPYYSASAITWESSNESIATVENGVVKAVSGSEETVTITAKTYNSTEENPIIAQCEVKVNNAAASVKVEMDDLMSVGQNQPVKVTLLDENGNETTGAYTIESNYPLFAMIYNGSVYARYATMDAYPVYITVKAYNSTEEKPVEAKIPLKIVAAPYYVTVAPAAATLGMGEKTELAINHYAPEAPTTYSVVSSNPNVAKVVEENGKYYVEAGSYMGYANIIVGTHNGRYAVCRVLVYNAPTSISLNKTSLTLAAGETATLTTTLTPYYAASKITWESSNESIATVENGVVKAVSGSEETVTITAKTYNSTEENPIIAQCEVKVNKAPATVLVEMDEIMSVGQNQPVKVKLLDEDDNETTGAYTIESNYPLFAMIYNGSVYARYATMEAYPVYITVKAYNSTEEAPVEAKIPLKIVAAPYAVQFPQSSAEVKLGIKGDLNEIIRVLPEETPATLSYASSNPSVISVNEKGEVETLKEGVARIMVATHNGKYAFIWLTVKADVAPDNEPVM